MGDAGGPGSGRIYHGVALADLGDTEGFEKGGEEGRLYAFELSDGVYKRKKVTVQEWGGAQKLGVDRRRRFICRPETASYAGVYWEQVDCFADPTQQTGWLIDIRISSPYVATRREHKVRKVTMPVPGCV